MKEDQSKHAAEKKSSRKGLHEQLRRKSPFALSEEEYGEAAKAELAEGAEEAAPSAEQPKKKRLLDRPSPFALQEEEFPQESGEDLDAQLQFQETETPIELPMDRERKSPAPNKAPAKKRRRHWYGIPVGMTVLVLAVIGLIFLGTEAYRYVSARVTDDSAERAYDTYLTPVVMLDPEPFETLDAADKGMVLQAAVWKTVFENASTTTDYDDNARIVFSGELVRSNAVRLFGVNCILTPMNVYLPGSGAEEGAPEGTIAYDAATDTYHVPMIGNVGTYQPYTVSVRNRGDAATLRVAYCVPANNVNGAIPNVSQAVESAADAEEEEEIITNENGIRLRVIKYMEYEIGYDEDTQLQYISAVRSPEEE